MTESRDEWAAEIMRKVAAAESNSMDAAEKLLENIYNFHAEMMEEPDFRRTYEQWLDDLDHRMDERREDGLPGISR